MAKKKYISQTDNKFFVACGATSGLMASYSLDYLHSITSTNSNYRSFIINNGYNNYVEVDVLANWFKKHGVPNSVSYSKVSTEKAKDYIIKGQPIVPIMWLTYWYNGGHCYSNVRHFVTVTGWKQDGNTLYFYTQDPYLNINSGWNDVNMPATKMNTGYKKGYNVYCTSTSRGCAVIFGNPIANVKNAAY